MKEWPKNKTEPARFEELVGPIREAVLFAYDLRRVNIGKDIPYAGYDAGDEVVGVTDPPADEKLKAENLQLLEDHGMDVLDVILMLAVQIGIEQGKRIERSKK